MATLNEESAIEDCVRSLLGQRYPTDLLEVVVVDGGSTDRTRRIVAELAREDARVRLRDNPGRIAATAFNIGVDSSHGDIISLVSAHSTTDSDYAAVLAEAFTSTGAHLVGGRKVASVPDEADTMAHAIVRATTSPWGLGSAGYHYSDRPGWVDTAFPGAYRRELFDVIGGFDEELVRNQDDELHLRARLAGHRMWYEPRLRSVYRPRSTLGALWRQYHEYGRWRWATLMKHRRVASPRQLAPAALVAGLVGGPALAAVLPHGRAVGGLWLTGVGAWAVVLLAAGLHRDHSAPRNRAQVSAAVACLHLSYGVGFWSAALAALSGIRPPRCRATATPR